jgi:medium-chain acyl-[acyl-carrier-protein] hydrolase
MISQVRRPITAGRSGLVQVSPGAEAGSALICVPQAGAGAGAYRYWSKRTELSDSAIWAARLPGRESRIGEPPVESVTEMAELLAASVLEIAADRITLFGHCSGALIAYETAHLLNAAPGGPRVERLAVSAQPAPLAYPDIPEVSVSRLSATELLERLAEIGGTSETLLANKEMMKIILPAIRADILAVERYYDRRDRPRVTVPIVAFGGSRDPFVLAADLRSWESLTDGDFDLHLIDGDHFFLEQNYDAVLRWLTSDENA